VMVNGKILMRDRRMVHLDSEEVMAKVREIGEKMRT
jgi:hypothetical protein